jgi:hypothetical protein
MVVMPTAIASGSGMLRIPSRHHRKAARIGPNRLARALPNAALGRLQGAIGPVIVCHSIRPEQVRAAIGGRLIRHGTSLGSSRTGVCKFVATDRPFQVQGTPGSRRKREEQPAVRGREGCRRPSPPSRLLSGRRWCLRLPVSAQAAPGKAQRRSDRLLDLFRVRQRYRRTERTGVRFMPPDAAVGEDVQRGQGAQRVGRPRRHRSW